MLIKVDDKEYQLITTEKKGIRFSNPANEIPIVYAHAQNSLDEVAAYIRQFQQPHQLQPQASSMLEFFRIELFDRKYAVKITRNEAFSPYIKGDLVYCSAKTNTDIQDEKFAKQLRLQLFEQHIRQRVGHWEEQLQVLANEISFRLLKASPYLSNADTKNICFNKQLMDLSMRTIDYFVFSALLPLLEDADEPALIGEYFPDIDQLLKQFDYG